MIIYFVLLAIIAILLALNYKKVISKKTALLSCVLLMAIIVGLRSSTVGGDTSAYLRCYQLSSKITYKDIFSSFPYASYYEYDYGYSEKIETVFLLYSKILMSIFKSEYAVQFITALLTFVLFGLFIKNNSDNYRLPILILLCEYVFFYSFNGVRQFLSIAIALQAIKYLRKRTSIFKPIIIVAFASLFHISTLFFFLLFPLFIFKRGKNSLIFSVILAFSVAVLYIPFMKVLSSFLPFFNRYNSYIGMSLWGYSLGGTTLMWLFVLVLFFLNFINKGSLKKQDYVFMSIYLLYLVFELLTISQTIFSRLVSDLRVFNILIIPYLMSNVSKSSKYGLLYKFVLMILLLGQFYSYASLESRMYSFFFF